jgi:hypothetical protein
MVDQTITVFEFFEFIGIIVMIIGGIFTISRQLKKGLDKFETTENSKLKFEAMDGKIAAIEKDVESNKNDNQREHDQIREEVSQKLDLIIRIVSKNKSA